MGSRCGRYERQSTLDDFHEVNYNDDEMQRCVSDTATWMTNLPESVTSLPIRSLAIPGSHDSGAYQLDLTRPVAPGM